MNRLNALRRLANPSIVRNAGSLAGTTAVTSVLGFAYWWLAARLFPPEAVGFTGAIVSAMTLLGTAGVLGVGTLLIGELARRPGEEGAFVSTALSVAAAGGGALGLVFALVAPRLAADFAPLAGSTWSVALFAAGVSLTSVAIALDQALIGLLRGGAQFQRNLLFAAAKLGLLALLGALAPGSEAELAVYATWVAGLLLSLLLCLAPVLRYGPGVLLAARPRAQYLAQFGRLALRHHALNLALQGSGFAMPIVVTAVLSAETNAYFYTAWMVAGFVFVIPLALTTALYAVGTRAPEEMAHKVRFTFAACLGLGVLANVGLLLSAGAVLGLFGSAYAEHAAPTLTIIGLGVFPIIVKDHYVAIQRMNGRLIGAALLVAGGGVLDLVAAVAGGRVGGLPGLALGWLIAGLAQTVFMAPTVYRALLARDASAADAHGGAAAGALPPG